MFAEMCWKMSHNLTYIDTKTEEMDNYHYQWGPRDDDYVKRPNSGEWVILPFGCVSVRGLNRRLRTALFFEHLGCRLTWDLKYAVIGIPYIIKSVYTCFFYKGE